MKTLLCLTVVLCLLFATARAASPSCDVSGDDCTNGDKGPVKICEERTDEEGVTKLVCVPDTSVCDGQEKGDACYTEGSIARKCSEELICTPDGRAKAAAKKKATKKAAKKKTTKK